MEVLIVIIKPLEFFCFNSKLKSNPSKISKIHLLAKMRKFIVSTPLISLLLISTILNKASCQLVNQVRLNEAADQNNLRQVESVRTSTRSVYRVRPFLATSTTSPFTKLSDEETNLVDDPIPTNVWVPSGLQFSCKNRTPGYYTDPSPLSKCQVYHMCMSDGRQYSMLCGIGTIFNQITFVCDHWYNYKCSDAETDYKRNTQLWDQFLAPVKDEEYEEYDEYETTQTTV